ncbi:MAG: TIGR04066 family peptide maturation system protein [Defluviitaleaceae bacterium]|nr:TIGR04066 family peptide maturation system protein [Defluviitaleaceae bacterium]MCL2275122.1 TIGR04066 family peptide maturation system protein [Defluviitaleaceae bacterium]
MDKKLALFPMTRNLCAVVRYRSLLQGYALHYAFCPSYMYANNKDVSQFDGGTLADITVTDYCQSKLMECDCLFIDYDENISDLSIYKDIIETAKEMSKELIFSSNIKQKLLMAHSQEKDEVSFYADNDNDILQSINVPIITVLSHGLHTDQFAVELALRKHFIEAGYKVSQMGSFDIGHLFGFANKPNFINEPRDAYEKTLRFNQWAHELVSMEQPELLIIGVPDSIMKYNNKLLHGMGVAPGIICNAIQSDLSIVCTHYGAYKEMFFDELSQYCKYRFDTQVKFYNLANVTSTPDPANRSHTKLNYIKLDSNYVLNGISDLKMEKTYLFNVLDAQSASNTCAAVQDVLTDNVRYMK